VVWEADPRTLRLTFISAGIERLFGHPASRWLSDPGFWITRVHPEDREKAVTGREKAVAQREEQTLEYRMVAPNGTVRWIRDTISISTDPAGTVTRVVGAMLDLTERRAWLEAHYQRAQKMELLGRLSVGIAHDFNNVLTVIGHCAEQLLETLDWRDERREDVQQIRLAAASAGGLTRQLLVVGRREAEPTEEADVNQVIGGLQQLLYRGLGQGVGLATSLVPRALKVRADAARIEQVVLNLIFNARDAMPAGGTVNVTTSIERVEKERAMRTGLLGAGDYVRIEVADTGIGMNECNVHRIFEAFYTTKPVGRGTGLGLAMVDQIVREAGGAVDVFTALGQGTRFEVLIPMYCAS
jgi:signal transduction histidine kinase